MHFLPTLSHIIPHSALPLTQGNTDQFGVKEQLLRGDKALAMNKTCSSATPGYAPLSPNIQ